MRAELDPSVLEALKPFDSPTLSNAIETFAIRPRDEGYMSMDIRCMFPELGPLVGYAATATIRARGPVEGDQTALYQHVRDVPGPRVVVVQDLDEPPGSGSLWGELMAAALLGSVPVAVLYSFFVDYFVAGMTAGAVKG